MRSTQPAKSSSEFRPSFFRPAPPKPGAFSFSSPAPAPVGAGDSLDRGGAKRKKSQRRLGPIREIATGLSAHRRLGLFLGLRPSPPGVARQRRNAAEAARPAVVRKKRFQPPPRGPRAKKPSSPICSESRPVGKSMDRPPAEWLCCERLARARQSMFSARCAPAATKKTERIPARPPLDGYPWCAVKRAPSVPRAFARPRKPRSKNPLLNVPWEIDK